MNLDMERLRSHYGSLTDVELQAEYARGKEVFSSYEVWRIVEALYWDKSKVADFTPGELEELETWWEDPEKWRLREYERIVKKGMEHKETPDP